MKHGNQDTRGIAREIALIAAMVAAAIVVAFAAPAYADDAAATARPAPDGMMMFER